VKRNTHVDPHCVTCGDVYPYARQALGYRTCLACGETAAATARAGWCIAPIAHKQGATLVTNKADLKGLNKYSAD
jgi:hypothetical protein